MEHRTDEMREGFGAAPGEVADEEREPSGEGETTTTATAVMEGAEHAEQQEEPASEGETTTTATAVAEGAGRAEQQEEEPPSEDETMPPAALGGTTNGATPSKDGDRVELYTDADMEGYRRRWDALLVGFVDDPRASTEQADALIGELVDRVSKRREQLRDELGRQDDRGETEAMRLAIRGYRAIYRALVRE